MIQAQRDWFHVRVWKGLDMLKLMVFTVVPIAMAVTSHSAWADPSGSGFHGGHHMWGGGGGWFFGPVLMLLTLAAIAVFVVLLVRWLAGGQRGFGNLTAPDSPAGPSPVDILKERFARGEIDKKEYEDRRKVLEA